MSLGRNLSFFRWFARRDLFEPNARRTTRVNIWSVGLVTALSFLAFGAAEGTRELRLAQFRRNPMALSLWAGNEIEEGRIDDALLADLKARLGKVPAFRGVFPFQPLSYRWYQIGPASPGEPGGDEGALAVWGRTLGKDDPLLDSLKDHFVAGGRFISPDQDGVIITLGMLDILRREPPAPTSTATSAPSQDPATSYPRVVDLKVINAKDERLPVPVVGVVDAALPRGQNFIINSAFERRLRTMMAPIRATRVRTGPVPKGWPGPSSPALPESVRRLLHRDNETYRILRRVAKDGPADDERKVWELETAKNGLLIKTWKTLLESLQDVMKKDGYDAPDSFVKDMVPIDPKQESLEALRAFQMAGISVVDPSALEPAATVLHSFNFPTDDDVIESLRAIDRSSQQAILASMALALVLLANGCSNMRVIQRLRAELKITEIGMLKAMGMDDHRLRQLHLYEAWVVWRSGTLWGVASGVALGYGLAAALPWFGCELGFQCPWRFLVIVPLATGAFFLYNAVAGTRRARSASPIETLRTN